MSSKAHTSHGAPPGSGGTLHRGSSAASLSRRAALATALAVGLSSLASCAPSEGHALNRSQRDAIADTLRGMIVDAYDLAKPGDAVARLMSLYPQTGTVISASGGQVSTSRDSLEAGIRAFWDNVGRNMRDPKWQWGAMHVDVLSPDAAVVTTTYRVPHLTPRGDPHVIAGAWTAVFQRRGGRWVVVQEHLSDLPPEMPMATR
jgi:ketosteroid isomerase-like protein